MLFKPIGGEVLEVVDCDGLGGSGFHGLVRRLLQDGKGGGPLSSIA